MALTQGQLLSQALETVGTVTSTCDAQDWLNKVLWEIDAAGYWRFLESTVVSVAVSDCTSSVAFSYNVWDAAASGDSTTIDDFSKGLQIWSGDSDDSGRQLIQISKNAYDAINKDENGFPYFFALWNDTIFFYPHTTAIVNATSHKMVYYKEITVPTSASEDIETETGIPPKYHPMLIDGVIAEGLAKVDDTRQDSYRARFEKGVMIMLMDNKDYFPYKDPRLEQSFNLIGESQ